MSLLVAFPDFSAHRKHGGGRAFTCTLQASDIGPAWVRVAGDLDIRSAPLLMHALQHTNGFPRLTLLDLRRLLSLDPSGADVIVHASARAQRAKHRLVLIRGPSQVQSVLALCDVEGILETVDLDTPELAERPSAWRPRTDDAA
jgi:anti-anti-sigma factor